MKRWWWIVVGALVLLGVGFAWFWSLASVNPAEIPEVALRVERNPVQVKLANESSFREGTTGMTLAPGAIVKTGEGGRAVIIFFDQAETRLDANSEATVGEATSDRDGVTVRVALGAGRVWSRVLRLFDLDSSFEVQTPSVVATVRGTTFDVRANADGTSEVWVWESAVTVRPTDGGNAAFTLPETEWRATTGSPALTAGESSGFAKDGKAIWRRPIPPEEKGSAWATENRTADELFMRAVRERREESLEAKGSADGLTRLSERMHLAFAKGEERDALASVYASRRLMDAIRLAESGKSGAASQVFSRFERETANGSLGADAERTRSILLEAVKRITPLLEDATPSSPAYPFKQRMEDLAVDASSGDEAVTLFARLRAADARLDEAARLMDMGSLEEAQTAFGAAHAGLENIRRDAVPIAERLNVDRREALMGKLFALVARDASGRMRLEVALRPTVPVATSTEAVPPAATSGSPVPTSTAPRPSGVSKYNGIALYVQPNPISMGATAKLSAVATLVGGGTEDVSTKSTYRVVSGTGTLAKDVFTAVTAGTVVFEATLIDQGKTMISRAALTVNGGLASLERLSVSASNVAPKPSEIVQLTGVAYYSNNFTQDVTGSVTWTNLDPTLGTISGNIFTPVTTLTGQAQLRGSYTENGVTKTADVFISVTAQQTAPTRTAPNN